MKKLSSLLLLGACTFLLQAASLTADKIVERTPVGVRAESIEVRQEQLDARANDISAAEVHEATKANSMKAMKRLAPLASKSIYYTSHPAAYQYANSIAFFGETVELNDGSIWSISSNDTYKTASWYTTDLIIITPNHSWLSSYGFCLTNQTTGEVASANLSIGPALPGYGYYTNWITNIDYYYNIVYLQDGSKWNMSSFDSSTVYQWVIGDVVIIGVNDGFLSSSKPNVLINVAMLNYAAGHATF